MSDLERSVLLTAFALGYKNGITDMDEAVIYSELVLLNGDLESRLLVAILHIAYKKFKGISE